MEKWKCIPVTEEAVIQSLLKRILTDRQISRLKFSGGILKNGVPARVTESVRPGDELWYRTSRVDLRPCPFPVLYEDGDLLILSKPAGVVCHASPGHEADSVLDLLGGGYLAGRLDKDTSGILVVAKDPDLVCRLSVQKTYCALVRDWDLPVPYTIDVPLEASPGRHKKSLPGKNGKACRTTIVRKEEWPDGILLTVQIEQGRMHQIRAHLAYAGHPIRGDALYGIGDGCRTLLHCKRCTFVHPVSGKTISLEAPFPLDFLDTMNG